jgi:3-methyladenine DNA glycosylase AlkC
VIGRPLNVRFGSKAHIGLPPVNVRFTRQKRTLPGASSMSALCQMSLHGVHKVRALAKEGADVTCGYPEVIYGTMVARQIFDKLLTLLASITRDAEPVDSTVEHHANRTACY